MSDRTLILKVSSVILVILALICIVLMTVTETENARTMTGKTLSFDTNPYAALGEALFLYVVIPMAVIIVATYVGMIIKREES